MRRKALSIAVGLTWVIGLLFVAGAAAAQAQKTLISGEFTSCKVLPRDQQEDRRIWTDGDGVKHVRDQKYRCRMSGDLDGRITSLENYDWDPVLGHLDAHGYGFFVGELLGEPAAAIERWTNECDREEDGIFCTEQAVWHLDDGSLAKITSVYELGSYPDPYSGLLIDPPGRH